jgi:hypothetical protein
VVSIPRTQVGVSGKVVATGGTYAN